MTMRPISTVNDLSSLLLTTEPKLLDYPMPFLEGQDAVKWAANICYKNARTGLLIQAMRSAFAKTGAVDDNSVVYLESSNPQMVKAVLSRISNGIAGHAALELLNFNNTEKMHRFDEGREFYEQVFEEALKKAHPLGHYAKINLWFSASEHVYEAHCDLADGFLFQLAGRKRVKVWPLTEECANRALFDHSDISIRQTLPCQEFELGPRQVLFIPGSAVHEVTVESGFSSVSLSFHIGSPFPLLSLFRDLKRTNRDLTFELPEELSKIEKQEITFFQPGRFCMDGEQNGMPAALRDQLVNVIQVDGCTDEKLAQLLDSWWVEKSQLQNYSGPYPRGE